MLVTTTLLTIVPDCSEENQGKELQDCLKHSLKTITRLRKKVAECGI